MNLVIINGYAGTGKDTFCKFCENIIRCKFCGLAIKSKSKYKYAINLHSSDTAKQALRDWGWSGEKTTAARNMLADIVDFQQFNGVLVNNLMEFIEQHINTQNTIFYHERNPEEIKKLVAFGKSAGARVVTVFMQQSEHKTFEKDRWVIENYPYDYYIQNDKSLEDLQEQAQEFIKYLYGVTQDGDK